MCLDDDYNVSVMLSGSFDATTDVSWSAGAKGEISFDADNVNSMSGGSLTYGANVGTPIVEVAVNGGYSRSFDGKTTSYSGGISGGNGVIPAGISTGLAYNKSVMQFNPVEWLKRSLSIK